MLHRVVVVFVVAALLCSEACCEKNYSVIEKFVANGLKRSFNNETIISAVNEVISSFYLKTTSILNFISCASNFESQLRSHSIIIEVLKKIASTMAVLLEDCDNIQSTEHKNFYNIFFVDSYSSFRSLFKQMTTDDFNYQGYFLIVMTQQFDDDAKTLRRSQKIFKDLWSRYIINVNILQVYNHLPKAASMLTYFPYTEAFCEEVHPVVIDTFTMERGFEKALKIFPSKMSNLFRCPISVAIFNTPPFVFIANHGELGIGGFEGIFLHQLAERMNFTFVKKTLKRKSWGSVDDRGNSSGAIHMVMKRQVNLTAGFFISSPQYKRWMSSSYEYFTTYLVWVIPPARPMTALERFVKPFHPSIWVCMIFIFLVGMLVTCVLSRTSERVKNFVYGANIRSPIMNMANILLGGVLIKLPRRNFARTLLSLYMFYTFVIRNAYTGALFRFLQMGNTHQDIHNLSALIKNNYKLFVVDVLVEHILPFEKVLKNSVFLDNKQFDDTKLSLLDVNNRSALLASEDHVAYWNKIGFPDTFYEVCPQRVTTISLCLYFHKTSCLTKEIDKNIFAYNSNGLMQFWKQFYSDRTYLAKKNLAKAPKQLKLDELLGGCYFYLFGLTLAIVCFMVELVSKGFKRLTN